jgi:hypothetical protein
MHGQRLVEMDLLRPIPHYSDSDDENFSNEMGAGGLDHLEKGSLALVG